MEPLQCTGYRRTQGREIQGQGGRRVPEERRPDAGLTSPTVEATARAIWTKHTVASIATVGDVMTAWLAVTTEEKGHKRASEAWRVARPFWDGVRPGMIDAAMCRSYTLQRGRAANTIRNALSAIRSALKWAGVKPAEPLALPAMPESEVQLLSTSQFRKFLGGCSAPHVRLFAQIAVTTGARSTALRELNWNRVDLDRGLIDLNPRGRFQTPNKRRATVPINDLHFPLLEDAKAGALTDWVIEYQGGPIASIRKGFEAASKRSGIHCTPHMLRHSAAVWMAEARTPTEEIAA